ncbi:MAG TPA: hypothetical protein VGL81_24140 [Polyangiaceae bacterium]
MTVPERHHPAEPLLGAKVGGVRPEPGRQQPIERRRRTATLQVPEHRDAYLVVEVVRPKLVGQAFPGPPQPGQVPWTRKLDLARGTPDGHGAFADDDDGKAPSERLPFPDLPRDSLDIVGDLRDQHGVRAAGNAGAKRDPPRVPPHHFQHHHALVSLRSRVKRVDGASRCLDRAVDAARHVGAAEVSVDGLRNADASHAELLEPAGDAHGPVAAGQNERVDAQLMQPVAQGLMVVAYEHERIAARRTPENASSARQDPSHIVEPEWNDLLGSEQALEAEQARVDQDVAAGGDVDEGAHGGVEPWGIASARQ